MARANAKEILTDIFVCPPFAAPQRDKVEAYREAGAKGGRGKKGPSIDRGLVSRNPPEFRQVSGRERVWRYARFSRSSPFQGVHAGGSRRARENDPKRT